MARMIPEERQRRRLAAVMETAPDDAGSHEAGPKPYVDIALARGRLRVVAWLTLAGFAVAESAVLLAGSPGVILYGVLTLALLTAGGKVASRRLRALLWALAVVPTSRLIAFGAPLGELGAEARLGLVGVLTLLATVVAMRATGLTRDEIGLTARWRQIPLLLVMVPVGLGLGVIERMLVAAPIFEGTAGAALLLMVVALGVTDDLFFQGVLFGSARRVMGRFTVPFVALLVALLHVAYGSLPLAACAFVAALLLGWVRAGTGSLGGVVVGHAALNVGVFVLGPGVAPHLLPLLPILAGAPGTDVVGLLSFAGGWPSGV